jgi:hypothetical protein
MIQNHQPKFKALMRQERARHSSLQHAVRKRREGNKVNSLMQDAHESEHCSKRNM